MLLMVVTALIALLAPLSAGGVNNSCYFVEDCQNYACPAAANGSAHNPADIIAPLEAFEAGVGYTQYQSSMKRAAEIVRSMSPGCNTTEGGLILHTTLK